MSDNSSSFHTNPETPNQSTNVSRDVHTGTSTDAQNNTPRDVNADTLSSLQNSKMNSSNINKTNISSHSLFRNKWGRGAGGTYDRIASNFPHQYPDGDICFVIDHVTKKPLVAWASESNGKRGKKQNYCLSVWICPSFTFCKFRI